MSKESLNQKSWHQCTDATTMLLYLEKFQIDDRKLRLFACACCRLVWECFTDMRSHHAIEIAELYADGLATKDELYNAMEAADEVQGEEIELAASMAAGINAWGCAMEVLCLVETKISSELCANLLRDLVPDPMTPNRSFYSKLNGDKGLLVHDAAQEIYSERRFAEMAHFAEILGKAGCRDVQLLNHCRYYPIHARGCWVIDSCLKK